MPSHRSPRFKVSRLFTRQLSWTYAAGEMLFHWPLNLHAILCILLGIAEEVIGEIIAGEGMPSNVKVEPSVFAKASWPFL